VIPHKSGNLYVYDSPTRQDIDYDVPSGQQCTVMTSFADYDVPHCNSSADYDIPVLHRDRVDPAASLSNRSSMLSVQSTGSQSSVASGRERHLVTSPESAVNGHSRSLRDSVLDDYDVPRCDFFSDGSTSADSGVYCGFQGPKVHVKPTAVRCLLKDETDASHDYDIPETYTTENHQLEVESRPDDNCVLAGLRDNALKNVERLVHWLNSEQTNHWSIQVKLAGLALKTSLQELLSVKDTSSQNYKPRESLGAALVELTRCLDCFTASSSSTHPYAISPGNRSQQSRLMTSPCSTNTFDAIQRLTVSLPSQVKQFVDDVIAGNKSLRVENVTSPSYTTSAHSAMTSPRSTLCRNKPPPVKPKPPKQLITSLKLQNCATLQNKSTPVNAIDEDGLSNDCDYAAIALEAERQLGTTTPHQCRVVAQKCSPPATLPPRPPISAKPPIAKKPEVVNSAAGTRPQLNDADRELIEFYATQIAAHTSVVEQAARDFYQCTSASSSAVTSLSTEVFVRRSRFVVLAGHKLVYLGDSLARHVTDEVVRDRVATAANELCNQLKTVVMATKQTALASPSGVESCERHMVESVSRATDGCRRLTSLIRDISCW